MFGTTKALTESQLNLMALFGGVVEVRIWEMYKATDCTNRTGAARTDRSWQALVSKGFIATQNSGPARTFKITDAGKKEMGW